MERVVVLSDVHLGSDLNDVVASVRRSQSIDEDLVKLLTHYRVATPPGDRVRVVFAGDLVDFIGMAVHAPGSEVTTERSREERAHGLGNAADHACLKLRMVVRRHGDVFDALADLVVGGHAIDIVHGNHDMEFHWDAVKDELRSTLLERANARHEQRDTRDAASFLGRIGFHPWFLYMPAVAYIEHGHQYDPFCASDCMLAPLAPGDPRRITRSVSAVLLRYVVRTTRGMREYGHETNGVAHYLVFGARLGLRGLLRLGASFASAVVELFRLRREHLSAAAGAHVEEHERRMRSLAETTAIGVDRMRALAALQIAPASHSIRGILASVLLDRVALGLATLLALIAVAVVALAHGGRVWMAAPCLVAVWACVHHHLTGQRHADPESQMLERASRLGKLFPAVFVVMGHTHVPARVTLNEGSTTYINVGSWAEEEPDVAGGKMFRAARTHLVIRPGENGPVAEFLAWGSDGPRPWGRPSKDESR